jgi:hypothetical protein
MLIDTLRETAAALEARGISVTAGVGDLVPLELLEELEKAHSITLPDELRSLYLSVGDGIHFSWEQGDMFGMFDLPSLADLLKRTTEFRAIVAEIADDPGYIDEHCDPAHRARAHEIWNSMRSWLRFHEEGNGDGFCIRAEDGAVVFDQHDWFDGFGDLCTTNGLVAGVSLTDFVVQWSRFFFTCPKSLSWGDSDERGRIDWDAGLFHPDYIRH